MALQDLGSSPPWSGGEEAMLAPRRASSSRITRRSRTSMQSCALEGQNCALPLLTSPRTKRWMAACRSASSASLTAPR
ncbi:hypothetical protein C7I87_30480 [Mesorhizobium sp. SARCC-RB16n]|nr:hypothetical protein C7I87_30480 [Mesorhizobium sp. SARCC-RB16n]